MSAGPDLPPTVPFVRYDPDGRVAESGHMEHGFIAAEMAAGGPILFGDGWPDTHHVDLTGRAPRLRLRRRLVAAFDTVTPLPGAPARIVLPPDSTIRLAGPVTDTVRAGGDVALVLRVPGSYAVTLEAWPLRPLTVSLTVPVTRGPVPEAPAGAIVVGPGLEAARARAKTLATAHYAAQALAARPAGLQASDLLKAAEAERVRAGGESDWLAAEAAERGVTVRELAEAIAVESARTIARERERTRVTGAIARAATESEAAAALEAVGLMLTFPPGL